LTQSIVQLYYEIRTGEAREEVRDMPRIGPTELIIVLVIILIIFGVGRLGEIGGALGKGIREFRKGQSGEADEDETPLAEPKPGRRKRKEKV
jgi:sec-independent protein translocase protein TatA